MRIRLSLRTRLIVSFALLSTAVAATLALCIVLTVAFSETHPAETKIDFILAGGILAALVSGIWVGTSIAGKTLDPFRRLAQNLEQEPDDDGIINIQRDSTGDEIDALTKALEHYNERIRELIKKEKSFTANASHELRTPIAVIAGAAEILEDSPTLAPGDKHTVNRIRYEADNIREQINLLLAIARGQKQFGDEKDLDITAIINEEIDNLSGKWRAKGIQIETVKKENTVAHGSALALKLVIRNILDNAISYTHEGKITVTTNIDSIVIEDTGPGIPNEIKGKVFERFFRGNQSGSHAHTGIGLSLVQQLCEASRWKMQIETATGGHGTKVTLKT